LSQELENSLQQAIDSYVGERLRAIDEHLSRLQNDFNEALARLRESSAPMSVASTPLAESIAAHLQTAREQKLSGAPVQSSLDLLPGIKRAVTDIEIQQTQSDVLSSLLKSSTQFAERVALFVIRNDQAIGWRECEASDASNVESIRGVALPLTADTIVTRAVRSHSVEAASAGSNGPLSDELGGEAQIAVAVPLVVRGKVVAVLYADSPSSDSSAINVEALELLGRISGMAVNLLAGARPVQTSVPREAATAAPSPTEPPVETVDHVAPQEPEHDVQPEPSYAPQIESQTAETSPTAEALETSAQAVQPEAEVEQETAAVSTPVESQPPPSEQPPAPMFTSSFSTPLGGARRYGVVEPELPIEVSEEERRLHNDARRFARLLVSEIKLYNEQKVKDGRSGSDLYDRLREDIDRSRQMYDKRVAPPVAARHDYFHQELVNTLAEGDPHKLGANYPGAALVS